MTEAPRPKAGDAIKAFVQSGVEKLRAFVEQSIAQLRGHLEGALASISAQQQAAEQRISEAGARAARDAETAARAAVDAAKAELSGTLAEIRTAQAQMRDQLEKALADIAAHQAELASIQDVHDAALDIGDADMEFDIPVSAAPPLDSYPQPTAQLQSVDPGLLERLATLEAQIGSLSGDSAPPPLASAGIGDVDNSMPLVIGAKNLQGLEHRVVALEIGIKYVLEQTPGATAWDQFERWIDTEAANFLKEKQRIERVTPRSLEAQ